MIIIYLSGVYYESNLYRSYDLISNFNLRLHIRYGTC